VVRNVDAGYGAVRVLHGVSIEVRDGETVALLGTNGNGKSTLIKCIMGMVRPEAGEIYLETDGTRVDLTRKSTEEIVGLGIALVPEGRRLFPKLTVEENLLLGAYRPGARADIAANLDFAFEAFPVLQARRRQLAGSMSGGEQQMLAVGRALMSSPRILLVDPRAQGAAPAHRAHGRAELQPGHQDRRPRLHHRPRQDRVRGPQHAGAARERAGEEILSGRVILRAPAAGLGEWC
jgi:branched-chain amino acid transport system ATP-binding protein